MITIIKKYINLLIFFIFETDTSKFHFNEVAKIGFKREIELLQKLHHVIYIICIIILIIHYIFVKDINIILYIFI